MIDGLLVIDKAEGWTSHDVVAKVRGILRQKKVGHSGTLDPDATGVLLLGLGRATRLLRYLTALPKTYVGEVVLGRSTSTLDASGETTGEWDMSDVDLSAFTATASEFVGAIQQVPPMVSAVSVGGRRLHELAREGIEVDREPRSVTVHRLLVKGEVEPGTFAIEVDCSSGTYIRSLAADIGVALGGGAHLRHLRRTAIGSFSLIDAQTIEAVSPDAVIPLDQALRDLPTIEVGTDVASLIANGRVLDLEQLGHPEGDGPWPVMVAGELLAVYASHKGRAKPEMVIPPAM